MISRDLAICTPQRALPGGREEEEVERRRLDAGVAECGQQIGKRGGQSRVRDLEVPNCIRKTTGNVLRGLVPRGLGTVKQFADVTIQILEQPPTFFVNVVDMLYCVMQSFELLS
jgi:hypothetical protein